MTQLASPPAQMEDDDAVVILERFTFPNVTWSYYLRTLAELGESRVRVTYDDGRMEIMSPVHPWHEAGKTVAARLIEFYAFEVDIEIFGYGSMTCQSKRRQKALEPDECYYVYTPAPAPTKKLFDFTKVPPPDLAIEADVTRSSIPREPIYAAIGVPELWRLVEGKITPMLLTPKGRYKPVDQSKAFPLLGIGKFNEFLHMASTQGQHKALKAFREWIHQTRD